MNILLIRGSAGRADGVFGGHPVKNVSKCGMEIEEPDKTVLSDLARMRMPFGKYEGTLLYELPEPYLVWYRQKGFPKGRLGMLLSSLYEIKLNGLESLLVPLVEGRTADGAGRTATVRKRRF